MRYPVYIISKGRSHRPITHNALRRMNVDHFIVIEQSDYEDYKHLDATLLILPEEYIDSYDTCDDVVDMPKGSGPARNFCIDHSTEIGFDRHWLLDDNMEDFYRLNRNDIHVSRTDAVFRSAEDFVDRFENVPLAGFNYLSFCKATDPVPPFTYNTKVYSCMLLDNTSGFRWRARFNEDVDISLRILKSGLCTILFNAFLCGKVTTKRVKGGNTDSIYVDGTLAKSKMIEDLHPDVAKVTWKFGRWHHHVDYRVFDTKLKLKSDYEEVTGINDYNMNIIPDPLI